MKYDNNKIDKSSVKQDFLAGTYVFPAIFFGTSERLSYIKKQQWNRMLSINSVGYPIYNFRISCKPFEE